MVAAALAGWAAEELTDDATLLVSELATNAVLHAGTDFEVAAQLLGDAVEVSVTDHHPTRTLPQPVMSVDEELEGGRGLFLTSSLAQMWGVDYTSTSKRVWFRLALPSAPCPRPARRRRPSMTPTWCQGSGPCVSTRTASCPGPTTPPPACSGGRPATSW